MRNSYKLRVRAVHHDYPAGAARVLLSGADDNTGSCCAVLLIVDTYAVENTTVPILDEEYVMKLSPPRREKAGEVRSRDAGAH